MQKKFRDRRTVLIYKGNESHKDLKNWHTITIFSILRRIIKKSLDNELRSLVQFIFLEHGFVRSLSGTYIIATLVDGCLQNTKRTKMIAA